jgi:hypothetical protein
MGTVGTPVSLLGCVLSPVRSATWGTLGTKPKAWRVFNRLSPLAEMKNGQWGLSNALVLLGCPYCPQCPRSKTRKVVIFPHDAALDQSLPAQ